MSAPDLNFNEHDTEVPPTTHTTTTNEVSLSSPRASTTTTTRPPPSRRGAPRPPSYKKSNSMDSDPEPNILRRESREEREKKDGPRGGTRSSSTNRRSSSTNRRSSSANRRSSRSADDGGVEQDKQQEGPSSSRNGPSKPRSSSTNRRSSSTTGRHSRTRSSDNVSVDGTSISSAERRHLRQQKPKRSSSEIIISSEGGGDKEKTRKEMVRESIREQILSKRALQENKTTANVQDVGVDTTQTFEQLWGGGEGGEKRKPPSGGLGHHFNKQSTSPKSDPSDLKSVGARSQYTMTTQETSVQGDGGVKRKTKLDKIKELQAKCDRYKKEWMAVTKGKNHCRKELEFNKLEVISLTKEIDTHVAETAILRNNLSESLQTSEKIQEEQRHERNEFSTAAKELAQERIDHAKSLNESRELRAQLDKLEKTLSEKDRRIGNLAEDLQVSKEKADDLDADIAFAETEILKLEDDIHKLEEELITYRTAAEKDDPNGNSENLRKARDEMEQKLHKDRERRLESKQQKLEEKIRQFEEERDKYLEKEKERDLDLAEQQRQESDKQKDREEERQRTDGEINQRLKQLEDDNTMLQGRLKSGQLDTSVKIKKKEDAIATLQKELADVKKQLSERDNDPNGMVALQKDVETAKAAAAMTRDDLEEAQKHNGMLEEEVEDLQTACTDLRTDIASLQKEFAAVKKESETRKKKAEEWQAKSGEWSDKAFQWKDKAEVWEKKAKELDPDANGEPSTTPDKPDPQALFLQAALEKSKKANNPAAGNTWLGGLFNKASEDDDEANTCVQELEEENNKQAEVIKNLRSEMVKMQTMFKEEAYSNKQQMQLLQKERAAVELKNTNLMKELELARKLESFANHDTM